MEPIRIDVGVCTVLTVKLSNFDFTGVKEVIFTVKNLPDYKMPAIIERRFTKAEDYDIVITPEESIQLKPNAEYDFNEILDDDKGTRVKIGDNGKVELVKGVGDCVD